VQRLSIHVLISTATCFAAPLVKIKQAIARTRHEAMQMDIRVGLLQHILLRQTLIAKLHLRDSVAAK